MVMGRAATRTAKAFFQANCDADRVAPSVTLKRKLREAWPAASIGGGLAMLVGVTLLLWSRGPLERWSYDLPYAVRPEVTISNVVIVYLDEASHSLLNQPYDGSWDRSLHAELVNLLTELKTKAI